MKPLLIGSLALTSAFAGTASGAGKGGGSVKITANVSRASVAADGIVLGTAGLEVDAAPGVHEYVVTSPGYVPRLVRVKVDAAKPKVVRAVELLPAPDKKKPVELNFAAGRAELAAATKDVAQLPSLCQSYNSGEAKLLPGLLVPCKRKTVLDDFAYFGLAGLKTVPSDGSPAGALRASLVPRVTQAASEDFYWSAEELYAAQPSDETAITLLAFSALRRKDCGRLRQIELELHGAAYVSPGLATLLSLCFELGDLPAEGVARLKTQLGRPATPANVAYYTARLAWRTDAAAAEQALQGCMKAMPQFYPCFEAYAHALALSGKLAQATVAMKSYLAEGARIAAEATSVHPRSLDVNSIGAAYGLRPWIFELAAAWLATGGGGTIDGTLVASPESVRKLLPHLEAKKQYASLDVAYQVLLNLKPKDASLWMKLAAARRNLGSCDAAIEPAERAMELLADKAARAALTVSTATCLIKIGKLDEAETQLTATVRDFPTNWSALYHLGLTKERLGKKAEAITRLEAALAAGAPEATAAKIKDMIGFLKKKPAKK